MAELGAAPRAGIARHIQRHWSDLRETTAFTRPQLIAAINAADTWADQNAAAYNSALPTAFRNSASLAQKTLVLAFVILRRAGLLEFSDGD